MGRPYNKFLNILINFEHFTIFIGNKLEYRERGYKDEFISWKNEILMHLENEVANPSIQSIW